eukprot:TRINITY_DN8732_c0_g1_i1.p1 TRINITY_DN8732_c0_g1~~TRINITY_DN8732_c0_g1_i1.p1  ORF type:complete len:121 (+),score=14.29 TRINITY_DN8732_c0_g1_i1:347-709(+)
MTCFNSWNWYLAFKGLTSIERLDSNKRVTFFLIVGGQSEVQLCARLCQPLYHLWNKKVALDVRCSVLKILVPWIKELPLNGLEWSVQYENNCVKELESKAEQFTIKIDTTEEKDEKRPFY